MGGRVCWHFRKNVLEDPLLRGGEVSMWRRKLPRSAAALRDREANIVADGRRFGMERKPTQARNLQTQCAGHIGGSGQQGKTDGAELFDIRPAVSQSARDSSTEENNVRPASQRHRLGMKSFSLRGGGLFLLTDSRSRFLIDANRFRRCLSRDGALVADEVHLFADLVDLRQFLRRNQAVSHHRLVDQKRARIGDRRNEIAPAEPGAGQSSPCRCRPLAYLFLRKWGECTRVKIERD